MQEGLIADPCNATAKRGLIGRTLLVSLNQLGQQHPQRLRFPNELPVPSIMSSILG